MRKSIVGLTAVLVLGITSAAYGHPSENRSEQGFGGGPHCHINLRSGNFAFPSHTAHIATGLQGGVFHGHHGDRVSRPGERDGGSAGFAPQRCGLVARSSHPAARRAPRPVLISSSA